MKATFISSLMLTLGLVTACGRAASPASHVSDATAARADTPTRLVLAKIDTITTDPAVDGRNAVTVEYWLSCRQNQVGQAVVRVSPLSLANPHFGVGVIVRERDIPCLAPDRKVKTTFSMPAIHGVYTFEPIQQQPAAKALYPARVISVKQGPNEDGHFDVTLTYVRSSCNETVEGTIKQDVMPIILANPHVALGVVLRSKGIACAARDVIETKTFRFPVVVGAYTFEPITQR